MDSFSIDKLNKKYYFLSMYQDLILESETKIKKYRDTLSERIVCAIEYYGSLNPVESYEKIVNLAKNCPHCKWLESILEYRIKEIERFVLDFNENHIEDYYIFTKSTKEEDQILRVRMSRKLSTQRTKAKNPEGWRKKKRARERKAIANNPQLKIRKVFKNRLRQFLFPKKKFEIRYVEIIGCSTKFLKDYLESQFNTEMNWSNYGKVWEIDHIIPCCAFDQTNKEHVLKCWNYKNLKPLEKLENSIKNDYIFEGERCSELKISNPNKLAEIRNQMLIRLGLGQIIDAPNP